MANRFWVPVAGSGTGTWDNSLTLHWSTTSGGVGGASAPVDGDTVTFDANSCPAGEVVTVNANVIMTSLTMGAFTGTLDFSTNNNSPTMDTFNCSGTGTRTLNMGSGTFTLRGNATTIWNTGTSTNLTLNVNTSVINLTYSGNTGTRTLSNGIVSPTLALYDLNVSAGSDIVVFTTTGPALHTLNYSGFTGSISSSNAITVSGNLTLGTGMSVPDGSGNFTFNATSGTQLLTPNGVTTNNVIENGVGGTLQLAGALIIGSARTLTLTNGTFNAANFNVTCGIFSSSNSNTRTLTMGSGTWTITGNNASVWNIGTVTGLTLTATTAIINLTYSGSTGTRSISSTMPNSAVEGPSLNITAGTDIIQSLNSGPRFKTLNFTGFTGTLTAGSATTINISDSLTMGTGMTNSYTGAIAFNPTNISGAITLTSNNVPFASAITLATTTGITLTLGDNLVNTSSLTCTTGNFNAANKNVTLGSFASSNSNTRTLTMGSGTWTLTGTGTIFNTSTTTGLTLDYGTANIVVKDATATAKTMTGGGLTYYRLIFHGIETSLTLTNIYFLFTDESFQAPFTDQEVLNILAGTVGRTQQECLNILAGTTGRTKQECWNIYAGTTNATSQRAANVKAGNTTGDLLTIQNCLHRIAGLYMY